MSTEQPSRHPSIQNLNDQQYASIDAINFSSFKHFLKSPLHYKNYLKSKQEETDAMRLGRAIHCAVLTPHLFLDMFAVAPMLDKRRTEDKRIWNEFKEQNAGKTIISHDDISIVLGIQEQFKLNPYFKFLNNDKCYIEQVVTSNLFGVEIKGRVDLYDPKSNTLYDVKSISKTPTVKNCNRAIEDSFYYVQAYFYAHSIKEIFGKWPTYTLAFVEKEEPFSIGHVTLSDLWFNKARITLEKELHRFQNCVIADLWPSMLHSTIPAIVSPYGGDSEEHTQEHVID